MSCFLQVDSISRHLLAWAETAPAGSVPAGLPDGPDLNLQDY